MATVTYSRRALNDRKRLAEFLREEFPQQAATTTKLIGDAIRILEQHPLIGRPLEGGYRELVISRGQSGYIALYRYESGKVHIITIWHQRETGFQEE